MSREDQWQPIETAPKDGTWVLAYEPYSPEHGKASYNIYLTQWWNGDALNAPRWSDACYSQPTHWMPLPDPPEVGSGTQATEAEPADAPRRSDAP